MVAATGAAVVAATGAPVVAATGAPVVAATGALVVAGAAEVAAAGAPVVTGAAVAAIKTTTKCIANWTDKGLTLSIALLEEAGQAMSLWKCYRSTDLPVRSKRSLRPIRPTPNHQPQ